MGFIQRLGLMTGHCLMRAKSVSWLFGRAKAVLAVEIIENKHAEA